MRRPARSARSSEHSQIVNPKSQIVIDLVQALESIATQRNKSEGRAMIIPPTWNLPPNIRTRLGQTTYGRQRTIVEEGHLLMVLHKPPGPDDTRREGVLFWRSPAGEWQVNRGGQGAASLKRHVQSYQDIEGKLVHDYEEAADTTALFNLLEALTPMARAARNMYQTLQTAREAIGDDPFVIEMRDLASEIDRNLELLTEDVRHAIQYRTAREAEEQAKLSRQALQASHRLNILAALFFPLTAIASLFGMNFSHGMNQNSPAIFWLVSVVSVSLGFFLKGWVLAVPKGKDTSPKS